MNVAPGQLAVLLLIDPDVFGDERGFFLETWRRGRYAEAGLDIDFVQDSLSRSRRGILGGLHFQNPSAQGKLVMAPRRQGVRCGGGSPAQLAYVWPLARRVSLGGEQAPVLSPPRIRPRISGGERDGAVPLQVHRSIRAANECAVRWDDRKLAIAWPIANPVLSAKDAHAPCLSEIPADRLFQ